MSVDPAINAALLNMCAQVHESGNNASSTGTSAATSAVNNSNHNNSGCITGAPISGSTSARPATDYEWLREALASVESPEKKVRQLLFLMENKSADGKHESIDPEERLEALEELSDMVEDVNWAAEFTLMEGPQRVLRVLRREYAAHPLIATPDATESAAGEGRKPGEVTYASLSLYTQMAFIIAHSSQLNEPVQAAYQAAQWADVLLPLLCDNLKATETVWRHMMEGGTSDETSTSTKWVTLLATLLHACSCLCRECPPNTIQFIQKGGLAVLEKVLQLTRAIVSSVPVALRSEGAEVPGVTTIVNERITQDSEGEKSYKKGEEVEIEGANYAPLISSVNKVTSRVFFFAAYLASTGVSSEEIIQLTCQHAEESEDSAVQKAAARELLELVAKSPKTIKEAVHAQMPKRLNEWKRQLQHIVGDGHEGEKDERQRFVEALDSSN